MAITPESVRSLLEDEDFGRRLSAVNQIRELPPEIGFELIQIAVQDGNARVRYAAISQLASLGYHDPEKTLGILRDRLLKDTEFDVQAAAADALGALKMTEAFADLKQVYESTPEWLIRFSILAALGELGDARGFDLLVNALQSGSDLERTAAVSALGELGDPRAVEFLVPLTEDSDWQIRYRLVQALGRFETEAAQAAIAGLVNDPMEAVAKEAQANLNTAP